MDIEVKLPKISDNAEKGQVSEILVSEGDHVDKEQAIIVVESDKAAVEVPVEQEGTVKSIKVKQDQEISTGDLILILENNGSNKGVKEKDEETDSVSEEKEVESKEKPDQKEEESSKKQDREQTSSDQEASQDNDDEGSERAVKASTQQEDQSDNSSDHSSPAVAPLAKKLARQLGISLYEIEANDQGRITHDAVIEHARALLTSSHKPGTAESKITLPDFSKWGNIQEKPLSSIRSTIAEKTLLSWREIPQVTQFDKADITTLSSFLKEENENRDQKITVTAVLIKVIQVALTEFPKFNASLDMKSKKVIFKDYYNISIAVATDNGLLMPVIKTVDSKGVSQLAEELNDLADKARNKKLAPQAMEGGNIALSNQGGIGGTAFTPIVFPPHVAIIGVSKAELQPIYSKEKMEWEPKQILPLSMSYDHRLIDGAEAAAFLKRIKELIEKPMKIIV
ncbi:2-oxo acid dehydrogenase subunit E2 [Fulvivirga sediminis]|uniref:Dihydrolipoamide acetyltransferase component of pyruvate dehydrogenase complex n=1 Tax=Fulvivirga sediminis TaxID=2803949 RepID=A0A937FC59_9BACT|nr:2-oxo acid dehydrogenase subunit E2 [Fulvivirga sediminis]MBL3658987.1 2-oxo acid dehydrogenase subunit E2 [Fulvivirga sediminis]